LLRPDGDVSFAYALPWWALALVACVIVALSIAAYAPLRARLTRPRWVALTALRALTLSALVICLMRPIAPLPPGPGDRGSVAVLVDSSRSMRLPDADGESRISRAAAMLRDRLLPDLARGFDVQLFAIGEQVVRADPARLGATARRSQLSAAIREVRERYRDRPLAGIVLVSDGGETDARTEAASPDDAARVPIVAVGLGSPSIARDREVRSVTVGPSALDASLVDLTATLVGHGPSGPAAVRVLQNGRVVDVRDVRLSADGSPTQEVFTVAPDRTSAATFRVDVAAGPDELTTDNNRVDVLVAPPGRPRRVLMVEGAPGFEHSFMKRAWHEDPSLQIDAVVRKGQNEQGQDTFYVQADPSRTAALTRGLPVTREALFAYDAIVFANAEFDAMTRDQLDRVADFVSDRGGGVLVFGARSLASQALGSSGLATALPVDLADRRGGVVLTADASGGQRLRVSPTDDGLRHPIMRLAASAAATAERWAAMPALASAALVGGPRPGATVLATTETATGATVPLVAVQRYGRGRTMVFSGEASWRWRMMMPATDRSYETFWRQSARWLAGDSPKPVSIQAPAGIDEGLPVPVRVSVRDEQYAPVSDADVQLSVRGPDGAVHELPATRDPAAPGELSASWRGDGRGIYRVSADARRGSKALGEAEAYVLVGGTDPEAIDPRLNEAVLRRMAERSGGAYLRAADADRVGDLLRAGRAQLRPLAYRDLWNNAWSLALIVSLLTIEWVLRRQWGLR
jgi:uncharacterized membrane protein